MQLLDNKISEQEKKYEVIVNDYGKLKKEFLIEKNANENYKKNFEILESELIKQKQKNENLMKSLEEIKKK